jgi:iron complex outermembrane recepter protein
LQQGAAVKNENVRARGRLITVKSDLKTRRSTLLASVAGCVALSLALGAPVHAQEEDDEKEIIVVTGFKAAIENAIAEKRENTSIIEAVSAEDIGKLPDVSIAEALARLPGLAAQRVRGRAQTLSVRGLGPDYTTALWNGREQVSSGDNRGVEFDQYPAELVTKALVYKTPDAQLVAQGLAGTVDLQTIRPLSYGDRLVSASASYEFNSQDELNPDFDGAGYRLTGTYVDQFANDTIGFVLSFADQNTPTQGEKYEICNFQNRGGAQAPECFKMFNESRDLDRTAVAGTLEFEPTDTLNASIDALYTTFVDGGIRRGIELPTGDWLGGGSGLALLNPATDSGFVTGGTFSPVFGVARNDVQEREADLFAIGGNVQWSPIDKWMFEADLSYSKVERSALDFESYFGYGEGSWGAYPANHDLLFRFNGDRYEFGTNRNYNDPSLLFLTDPGGWGQDGFHKTLNTDDELMALRASATREFDAGLFSSVEAGVYVTSREKVRETIESYVDLASGNPQDPFPSQYLLGTSALDWVSNISVLAYDPSALLANGVYNLRPLPLAFIPNKQWTVEEEVVTGYVQGNFDTDVMGKSARGNVGVQVVHTDQFSTGPGGFGNQQDFLPGLLSGGTTFTEVLPSANVSVELKEDMFLRLGAARTLSRARMDDMRASVNISNNSLICPIVGGTLASYNPGAGGPNDTCITGGGGNPELQPYIANSFDISLEKYFGSGGYWSVAAFHKEIEQWVFGSVTRRYVADPALIDGIFGAGTAAANPGIENASYSAPENSDGGWLRGLEFSLSLPGEVFLPEPLHGFGIFATYSVTDSEIQPEGAPSPITIPGLSEELGNVTVYFERDGFEARISNRFRGEFLGELPDFTGQPDFRTVFDEAVVDAQIGYSFQDGRFDGLTLQFQANNLTDERFGTFINGDERQARNWEEYGTTYTLRASYTR